MNVILHETKTHLSRLIAAVEAGEEVVVFFRKKPVVRIVTASGSRPKRIGVLAKRGFHMDDEFNSPKAAAAFGDMLGVSVK